MDSTSGGWFQFMTALFFMLDHGEYVIFHVSFLNGPSCEIRHASLCCSSRCSRLSIPSMKHHHDRSPFVSAKYSAHIHGHTIFQAIGLITGVHSGNRAADWKSMEISFAKEKQHIHIYIYMCINIYICIHIYIEREREKRNKNTAAMLEHLPDNDSSYSASFAVWYPDARKKMHTWTW